MRGEYRPDRFCSAHGPLALLRVSEVCCSLSRRCSRQRLLLPGPVSGDGFRSVDLPRELARYRGMLAFDASCTTWASVAEWHEPRWPMPTRATTGGSTPTSRRC